MNRLKLERIKTATWIIPAVLSMVFLAATVVWSIYISMTNLSLLGEAARRPLFVGLDNYIKLFNDAFFYNSIKVSFIFTLMSALIGQAVLGLILAHILKKKDVRGKLLLGISVTLAWVIPDIVVVYVWGAFLAREGALNTILSVFGVKPVSWLTTRPMESVIIANIWRGTAFSMILFSSALETVNPELYEAADIDGASMWKKFRFITFPLIFPVIMIDLLLITIWTWGYFTLIYGLTGGGPGHLTEVQPVFIYRQAFQHFAIGYGAAISMIMMLIVGSMVVLYLRLLKMRRLKV